MTEQVVGINPAILRWARETQGLSVEEVGRQLKRDASEIARWESGDSAPTYAQLETLAYGPYKRPIAVFFLPAPPLESTVRQEFRTLPDTDLERLEADTRFQVRRAHGLLLSLRELHEGQNPSDRKIWRDISLTTDSPVGDAARLVREYLKIPLQVQIRWPSTEVALKGWRSAVEAAGVYVFKNSFRERAVSAFCIFDEEFPLVYINNSTPKTRQQFSLFHELGHILLGMNSITKVDQSYIPFLSQDMQRVEVFCNSFAAELLMPVTDFDLAWDGRAFNEGLVESLAERYQVSRETVLRRLLDKGVVSRELYERKAKEWADEAAAASTGGNYYATQSAYLGDRYLQLVFGKHYRGELTLEQTADHLGVRTKSVAGLEQEMLRKAAAG